MDRKHLDIPIYNHTYLKILSIILTSSQDFSVPQTSVELEELIFKHFVKSHKSKYISQLHAFPSNTLSCKYRIIY